MSLSVFTLLRPRFQSDKTDWDIPVSFDTQLKATKVAVFQDANPESAVAVFTIPENAVIDYAIRIKLAKTGTVTVIAEADGKLYSVSKLVKVTIGGCGGWFYSAKP